ncbi:MAG: cytochrome c peroxidase [Bacteroidota bacterium]
MKRPLLFTFFICLCFAFGFIFPSNQSIGVNSTLDYYKAKSKVFATTSNQLKAAIQNINTKDSNTIKQAKQALVNCRLAYKPIEFFLEYFIPVTARPFNVAPVYEVEEPHMEFQHPKGMQYIEALLFEDNIDSSLLAELQSNAELVNMYANDLNALLYELTVNDEKIIESLQLELLRNITLGISGFDAPELKSGILESHQVFLSIQAVLTPYLNRTSTPVKDSVNKYLQKALDFTNTTNHFDSFNRLIFLTEAALPLQNQLKILAADLNLTLAKTHQANQNLFAKDALNIGLFPNGSNNGNEQLTALGKELFFEKSLSGNGMVSCASCHNPTNYFTDNLEKSIAFNGISVVNRNAPTLLYAAFQHGQFLDARAQSLEEQIEQVLFNKKEMNAKLPLLIKRLNKNKRLLQLFQNNFPNSKKDSIISIQNIALAIASFERTLAPMNSPFDNYMRGDKKALSNEQIEGFNLFMGKAQCGTCHFAPLFNGLLPPNYAITELEVLGTTKNTNFNKPTCDADSGRFHFFPIEYNVGAFKTPTIRNIERTAPYMHNGNFKTLEEVMEFYNKGGGNGLGLTLQHQTLPSKPLDLSDKEIKSIISFMKSLTDELPIASYSIK